MAGGGTGTAPNTGQNKTQLPQWMQGLQLGQQIAQMGQQQRPQGQAPMIRPGMGGAPQGMPQGAVPGAQGMGPQGMAPPVPSQAPGMATGTMGMPGQAPGMTNTGQQQISPQMLQMLMQQRQRGGLMGQ
jgi:hypothetical protein